MKSLLIVGAGGYGRLVAEIAAEEYDRVEFLDDHSLDAVGKIEDLERLQSHYDGVIAAIGNPAIRKAVFQKVKHPVTVVHPRAVVSKSAQVAPGCVIEANAVINTNATVEKGCFLCAGAIVNHDAVVQAFCQIDCNAVVESASVVPEGTKVESCTMHKRNLKGIEKM